MHKVTLYIDRSKTDKFILEGIEAFKKSIFLLSENVNICKHLELDPSTDIAILFGIPSNYKANTDHRKAIHKQQRKKEKYVLVFEKGFLDRDNYYSVGWNSIVGMGTYLRENKNMPFDRLKNLNIKLQPYKPNPKGYILICGQIPNDTQLQHVDYLAWLSKLIILVKKNSKREIVFRGHPKTKIKYPIFEGIRVSNKKTLKEDMKQAYCVVTYNSNSALEAMIEGIPFFTFHCGSMVHDLANHELKNLDQLSFPTDEQRLQKLANISYCQWNLKEIEKGIYWNVIKESMEESVKEHQSSMNWKQ